MASRRDVSGLGVEPDTRAAAAAAELLGGSLDAADQQAAIERGVAAGLVDLIVDRLAVEDPSEVLKDVFGSLHDRYFELFATALGRRLCEDVQLAVLRRIDGIGGDDSSRRLASAIWHSLELALSEPRWDWLFSLEDQIDRRERIEAAQVITREMKRLRTDIDRINDWERRGSWWDETKALLLARFGNAGLDERLLNAAVAAGVTSQDLFRALQASARLDSAVLNGIGELLNDLEPFASRRRLRLRARALLDLHDSLFAR